MDVSDIQFRVAMEAVAISMSLPDWNTHSAFLTERSATFATAPELSIDGTYRFYAAAHPDNVERLALKVDVRQISLVIGNVLIKLSYPSVSRCRVQGGRMDGQAYVQRQQAS